MYQYASSRWQRVEGRPAPTRCQTYASRASARRKALRREGHLSDRLRCSRRGTPKMPASLAAGRLQQGHKALTGVAQWQGTKEGMHITCVCHFGTSTNSVSVSKVRFICVGKASVLRAPLRPSTHMAPWGRRGRPPECRLALGQSGGSISTIRTSVLWGITPGRGRGRHNR